MHLQVCLFVFVVYFCPKGTFGGIIIAISLSLCQYIRASHFVFSAYLLYSLRQESQIVLYGCILGWGCRVPFLGHCDFYLWPSFWNSHWVWYISPIFFELGIPILACGCILGWQSVAYHDWVTMTLTSYLVFGIGIESGTYLLYSLSQEFHFWCVYASWEGQVSHTIFRHSDFDLWPSF